MALTYTITDLPAVWPGKRTTFPKKAPFKSHWTRTQANLERELKHLGARKVEIALQLRRGAFDLRNDGMLRSDARPDRAVILSFIDADGQRQAYPCDTYGWWQDNLHAIAVVLEDLRRAERYGVQSSLIRAGFKALPGAGQSTPTLDVDAASSILASFSDFEALRIRQDAGVAQLAIRQAIHRTHPDRNDGSRQYFDSVEQAKQLLQQHHGGRL